MVGENFEVIEPLHHGWVLVIELMDISQLIEQDIDLGEAFEQVLEKYRSRDMDRWGRKEG